MVLCVRRRYPINSKNTFRNEGRFGRYLEKKKIILSSDKSKIAEFRRKTGKEEK